MQWYISYLGISEKKIKHTMINDQYWGDERQQKKHKQEVELAWAKEVRLMKELCLKVEEEIKMYRQIM